MARERQLLGRFYGQSWDENGACGAGHPTKRAKHPSQTPSFAARGQDASQRHS
jgi:hypothetical protein